MTEYAIVNLVTKTVVPQAGQSRLTFTGLSRVDLPGADRPVIHNPLPGYEYPPQYAGEPGPPAAFRIYEVVFSDTGAGPVVASRSDPVFNDVAGTVTVSRTLEAAPPPPTPPLTAEELFDILKAKSVVGDIDRPRPKP